MILSVDENGKTKIILEKVKTENIIGIIKCEE
jgi:hypothetical protein